MKYALVTASSTGAAAGGKGVLKIVPTNPATGVFQFVGLPPGTYRLCAQVPQMVYGANEDRFTDSCLWPDKSSPLVTLVAGQVKTGAVVTLARGHLVKVRVNDPGKLLPAAAGKHAGNVLAIHIAGRRECGSFRLWVLTRVGGTTAL